MSVFALPQISLDSVQIKPGQSFVINLKLSSVNDTYSGFTSEILLPNGIIFNGVESGELLDASFIVDYRDFYHNANLLRIIVSSTEKVINRNGTLLSLYFKAPSALPNGNYLIKFTDNNNQINTQIMTRSEGYQSVKYQGKDGLITVAETINNNQCVGDACNKQPTAVYNQKLADTWGRLVFSTRYENPVIIVGIPANKNAESGVVRVKKLTESGVDLRFQEWRYLDGKHPPEDIPYAILKSGLYNMSDGSIWEVGTFQVGANEKKVKFEKKFTQKPELILTLQTANNIYPAGVSVEKIDKKHFKTRLFFEEKINKEVKSDKKRDNDNIKIETVGYVAIYSPQKNGTVNLNGQRFSYTLFNLPIDHEWTTINQYQVHLDEDQSEDKEVKHQQEDVSLLFLNQNIFGQSNTLHDKDPFTLRVKPLETK